MEMSQKCIFIHLHSSCYFRRNIKAKIFADVFSLTPNHNHLHPSKFTLCKWNGRSIPN